MVKIGLNCTFVCSIPDKAYSWASLATMSREIYFGGSISGGRDDADLYARLIEQLRQYGKALTEHVGNSSVEEDEKDLSDKEIHDRDMEWLNECDYLVAEVTQPSLGVGYEIGRAVDLKKTILCLFRPQSGKGELISLIFI
ncbi:putative 2'-deoxynucleoside 5'-phosphate N-hydrolase 1 [Mytilus edulis]|uniref:putative 2'-deoxynucleoside 5'-phosphate N-hydrolase 1 n=1 Tax=Mytilus edulis TaxID=6550 RepID=UPI0039EE12B9